VRAAAGAGAEARAEWVLEAGGGVVWESNLTRATREDDRKSVPYFISTGTRSTSTGSATTAFLRATS
jgi:hypothetical protein